MSQGVKYTPTERTTPQWRADFGGRRSMVPYPVKVSKTAFKDRDAVKVTLSANAAQGVALINFNALNGPIPSGTTLKFVGVGKFASTTAAAPGGGVSVAVEALPTALVTGDTAYYSARNRLYIPSGTFVGRTIAERDAGAPLEPWSVGDDDGESHLTFFDILNALENNDGELYRHGNAVRENFLPDWDTLGAQAQAKIRQLYLCEKGFIQS